MLCCVSPFDARPVRVYVISFRIDKVKVPRKEQKYLAARLHVLPEPEQTEEEKWLESLETVLEFALKDQGPQKTARFLDSLTERLRARGVEVPRVVSTPYINTIPADKQAPFPGDWEMERRLKSYVRWNAMAMVVNANREHSGLGGHISTYASSATLCEVGFNHFFRGRTEDFIGDMVYFQGHATPGIYARAFLEGRLDERHLQHFRQELAEGGGLSSYPHPYLMPDFWQFPTVSMGLGPLLSIYQARFNRYLRARGFINGEEPKVWAFIGDGETDEPETLGSLTLAARENLDNLIWVVNCNLQRLDGPVRGNGKIIQELEAAFQGAGWNVIKVIWGSDWDKLLAADKSGLLLKRMEEAVDGDYQKYSVEPGSYTRRHFFGKYPELLELVNHLTDEQIHKLLRGGHDSRKVYAAYKAAMEHKGQPTVILAKTVKGYGLGEAGEGRNITHQQKKLNEKELREFRARFGIPVERRGNRRDAVLPAGGGQPRDQVFAGLAPEARRVPAATHREGASRWRCPSWRHLATCSKGRGVRRCPRRWGSCGCWGCSFATRPSAARSCRSFPTRRARLAWTRCSARSAFIRPRASFTSRWIAKSLLYYNETKDGQILEEGITEAGSMASFVAAGTSYATHGRYMVPFYVYYSMFGFQRIGDLMWLAGDIRAKGFLLGATSGRTTLNGEGLQHQDGHSLILSSTIPTLLTYDPAFTYELAVIIADGLRRMYVEGEDIFYYLTLYNENYEMPPMPEGVAEGILKGLYKFKAGPEKKSAQGAYLRQRADHPRGSAGAANPGGAIRRVGRCLERDQLQAHAQRRAAGQALEHAAPARPAEEVLRGDGAGGRAGGLRRRLRQPEDRSRPDRALGSRAA